MKDISVLLNHCQEKCNPTSKEILKLFLETFDSEYVFHIEAIYPNCTTYLSVPENTYGYKPGKRREYKVVCIRFFGLPFDCLDLGLVKNTTGPGTGYVVAVVSMDDNDTFSDDNQTKAYSVSGVEGLENGFKKLAKFVENWVHEHRGVKTGKSTGILDSRTMNFSDFLKLQD